MRHAKRKRTRRSLFFTINILLCALIILLLCVFPALASSVDKRKTQRDVIAQEYYNVQSENNQLRTEVSEVNTKDYAERVARREYGYCWYGETVYTVGNLDEIQIQQELAAEGQH